MRDKIHTELLSVRISPVLNDGLDVLASNKGMNKAEYIRLLIQNDIEKNK
jgi:predicted DNA-binding protein